MEFELYEIVKIKETGEVGTIIDIYGLFALDYHVEVVDPKTGNTKSLVFYTEEDLEKIL